MNTELHLIILGLILLGLYGCGLKGPLYLPLMEEGEQKHQMTPTRS